MYGGSHENGIINQAMAYLFGKVAKLTVSFIEYYEGKWRDLVTDGSFDDDHKNNYQETEVISVQNVDEFFNRVLHRRKTKSTNQNNTSSRSHAILTVSSGIGKSKLLFIDMAGNESLEGKVNVNETCFINKSLTQLNTVLSYKAKGHSAPPYRDNNFTKFLKPYMIKNKVIIFYHVRKENLYKQLSVVKDCMMTKKKNQK